MMKFFKSLSMRFGVRFAVGGMLYRPRDQWPSPLPPEMCYGNLPPPNHWSADQVPMQDRTVKRTVDFKGNKRIHFVEHGLPLPLLLLILTTSLACCLGKYPVNLRSSFFFKK